MRDHKPDPLVGIDTQIARWAYDPNPRAPDYKVRQATRLMENLGRRNIQLAIAVISLEEMLRVYKPNQMGRFYTDFIRTHYVIPYDVRVAMEAARIYQLPVAREVMAELSDTKDKSKKDIYDDIKIIATGTVFSVAEFYSDDGNLRRIGKEAGLNVLPMPSQASLFDTTPPDILPR